MAALRVLRTEQLKRREKPPQEVVVTIQELDYKGVKNIRLSSLLLRRLYTVIEQELIRLGMQWRFPETRCCEQNRRRAELEKTSLSSGTVFDCKEGFGCRKEGE